MKKIISVTVIYVTLTMSCSKDWLDKKPNSLLSTPNTLQDLQAMLDNNSIMNSTNHGGEASQAASDDGELPTTYWSRSNIDYLRNAYTWSEKFRIEKNQDWIKPYQVVFTSNLVLDALNNIKSSPSEIELRNNIEGSALFYRTRAFFGLSQQYAGVYRIGSNDTESSIPLRLESDVNIPTKRSTLSETYLQMIEDISKAVELLPITAQYKSRPSKVACFALLSKIHLWSGEYQQARRFSDSVIKYYNNLLQYSTLSTTASRPFAKGNQEVILIDATSTSLSSNSTISQSLYDSYDQNDLRKKLYFTRNTTTNVITFKGSYDGTALLFTGIALDEIYLINAEANARTGDVAKAMTRLNALLRTRWEVGKYVDLSASNESEALTIILRERRKELLHRCIRLGDIKRLNLEPERQINISHTYLGETFQILPNDPRYIFPIPDDIVEATGIKKRP